MNLNKVLASASCALSVLALGTIRAQAVTRTVPAPYPTIQSAVNASLPGDTISIAPGAYNEQVIVTTSDLTIIGSGSGSTIIQPLSVVTNSTSLQTGSPIAAIVLVDGASGVTIEQLSVDGSFAGALLGCSPAFMGIFYRAASGLIADTRVANIFTPLIPDCQGVIGVFVQSENGGPNQNASVVIDSNTVDNYGKNGITANGPGTFVTVTDNIVIGRGALGLGDAAQNGVQLGTGAHGKVGDNNISGNNYTPSDFVGCGILAFKAGGAIGQTRSNTFSGNEQNVCNTSGGPSQFSPFN
jgi:hypothetical protein